MAERILFFTLGDYLRLKWVHEIASDRRDTNTRGELSILNRLTLGVIEGIITTAFVFLASLKYWVLLTLGVCIYRYYNFKAYVGNDMLGGFSNGRLFFSGILGSFGTKGDDGAPSAVLPSCVTLPEREEENFKESKLNEVLLKWDLQCKSVRYLARKIDFDREFPAFLPEEKNVEFSSTIYPLDIVSRGIVLSLSSFAADVLERVLTFHREVNQQLSGSEKAPTLSPYGEKIREALTPTMQKTFGAISKDVIATSVLAALSGKLLTYKKGVDGWSEVSCFPHLNARAVLYSLPSLAKDFSNSVRTNIRQSLVYAKRRGVFVPIQLPRHLSSESFVLRQIVEIVLATPGRLDTIGYEVRLFAALREINENFIRSVSGAIDKGDPRFLKGAYYTSDDLLYVPLMNLLHLFSSFFALEARRSFREVLGVRENVYWHEDLADSNRQAHTKSFDIAALKCWSPNELSEVVSKLNEGGVKVDAVTLAEWEPIKIALQYFGWLSHRIGTVSVNEASVVNCSFRVVDAFSAKLESKFVHGNAVVPIRGSRIRELVPGSWEEFIEEAESAVVIGGAETLSPAQDVPLDIVGEMAPSEKILEVIN